MYKCEYCQKTYSTKHNLLRHQKTTKSCLMIRNETPSDNYPCEFCRATFSHKSTLCRHYSSCPSKKKIDNHQKQEKIKMMYEEKLDKKKNNVKKLSDILSAEKMKNKELTCELLKLKIEISELKSETERQRGIIDGLKTAPDKKTIYNTAIHPKLVNLPIGNIPALTHEYMIEKVNDGILTYEKATKGYRGILEVICDLISHENDDGIVERNYVCTDVSRNSFHRLLESKKWRADKGGRYLNNILDTFRTVMEEYKDRAYKVYKDTPHDSFEWGQVDWERKNVFLLYGGIVCREGSPDRGDLVNIIRKEISKRASV